MTIFKDCKTLCELFEVVSAVLGVEKVLTNVSAFTYVSLEL